PSDTMLIYCNLVRSRAILSNYFGSLVDHSVYPAFGDWSPVAYTLLGGGPGIDSVAYAIWKSGIRTIVIRPEFINANPSAQAATATAGGALSATAGPADPYGYGPEAAKIPVYAVPGTPGRLLGYLKIVA